MLSSQFNRLVISAANFDEDILTALGKKTVTFTVKWTPGGLFKFHKVNWKKKGGTWKQAIPETFNSSSGNESIILGEFDAGTSITLKFKLESFSDIPQAVAMIVQNNPAQIDSRTPQTGFKALLNGDPFAEDMEALTV